MGCRFVQIDHAQQNFHAALGNTIILLANSDDLWIIIIR